MRFSISRQGIYVVLRFGTATRDALGFKVKLKRDRLFSEREGFRRGFCIGPLYLGTYRRPTQPPSPASTNQRPGNPPCQS